MDDNLLESLLHDDEGTSLDFKEEQYPFQGATPEKKSELLKDLLAMVNAWRRGPAHILVGVEEVRGGRSRIIGEDDHPGEHNLQQFTNAKTNRPIEFSYRVHRYEDKRIGVFRIPRQQRPFYVEKDFGRLEARVVYVRRGSATDKADPDEVARMGAEDLGGSGPPPTLELEWADLEARERLGRNATLEQVCLHPKIDPELFEPRRHSRGLFNFSHDALRFDENPNYHEQLVDYVFIDTWLSPLGFSLKHVRGPAAENVELVAEIERSDAVTILDPSDGPVKPSRSQTATIAGSISPIGQSWEHDVKVEEHPGHWTVTVPFNDVAPQRRKWSSRSLYVGATDSTTVAFTGRLFADNLPEPLEVELELVIDVEKREMEPEDLRPYLDVDE